MAVSLSRYRHLGLDTSGIALLWNAIEEEKHRDDRFDIYLTDASDFKDEKRALKKIQLKGESRENIKTRLPTSYNLIRSVFSPRDDALVLLMS